MNKTQSFTKPVVTTLSMMLAFFLLLTIGCGGDQDAKAEQHLNRAMELMDDYGNLAQDRSRTEELRGITTKIQEGKITSREMRKYLESCAILEETKDQYRENIRMEYYAFLSIKGLQEWPRELAEVSLELIRLEEKASEMTNQILSDYADSIDARKRWSPEKFQSRFEKDVAPLMDKYWSLVDERLKSLEPDLDE